MVWPRRLDPRFESIRLPQFWTELDQNDPGLLNEQNRNEDVSVDEVADCRE
jgi:hypothetical protein